MKTDILSEKGKKTWISPIIVDLSIEETEGGANSGPDELEQS